MCIFSSYLHFRTVATYKSKMQTYIYIYICYSSHYKNPSFVGLKPFDAVYKQKFHRNESGETSKTPNPVYYKFQKLCINDINNF